MTIFKKTAYIPTVGSSLNDLATHPGGIPAGEIDLNGDMKKNAEGVFSFIDRGYASSILIGSGGNATGVNFTVTGTYQGKTIKETLSGPNDDLISTDLLFETVSSVFADGALVVPVNVGANYNIAVQLDDNNSDSTRTRLLNYDVLLSSITAVNPWAAGSMVIYGVADKAPGLLSTAKLQYGANRDPSYFPLVNPNAATSAANLTTGVFVNVRYPFESLIVYLNNGINSTPVFVEVAQS